MPLIVFAITYNIITLFFIVNMLRDQSASLELAYMLLAFWIIGAVALILLFWLKKATVTTIWDGFLVFLSSPIPAFLFFLLLRQMSPDVPNSTTEYNKNGYRHREVHYNYPSGKPQRVEYYISQDSISTSGSFPPNDVWVKDSTWIYYNKDGSIKKTIKHSRVLDY
jgi:hypothetical protein